MTLRTVSGGILEPPVVQIEGGVWEERERPIRICIKHRFAVLLEDAVLINVPDGVDPRDIDEWARENFEAVYLAVKAPKTAPTSLLDLEPEILWEDEHVAEVDLDLDPDERFLVDW